MEKIFEIVKKCETIKDVIISLGWNVNGSSYEKVKKIINDHSIDISHFLNPSDYMRKYNHNNKKPINEILTKNSNYPRGSLKRRLVKEKLLEYKCNFCENDGTWNGKKISLILDHINGINNDNRLENLRFLCPNCNATLDTHCGKNVKNKKNKKEPKIIDPLHHVNKNKHLRKIKRPEKEILKNDVINFGYSATGRKYGVSDNTIRKWLMVYEK